MSPADTLPAVLPSDPMALFAAWFEQAHQAGIRNSNAMCLATVDKDGGPAARMVLCKRIDVAQGYVVFYTNYDSAKGRQLAARPAASAVFYWEPLGRQVRLGGTTVASPAAESDAYFASRDLDSRIGAWASEQSRPVASRAALLEQVAATRARYCAAGDAEIPRPPHWGGFRLHLRHLEMWVEGAGRVHDRALWQRDAQPENAAGPWQVTRLQP